MRDEAKGLNILQGGRPPRPAPGRESEEGGRKRDTVSPSAMDAGSAATPSAEAAAAPSPTDWRLDRYAAEVAKTCEDGDNRSRKRRAPGRNVASPFQRKTFPKTVVILVLCLLLLVDCLASSPNEYRNRRTRIHQRLRRR